MKFKNASLPLILLTALVLSACQSVEPTEIPVVPESTSHLLPAGIAVNDLVSRVGVTTLLVPDSLVPQPAEQNDFLQAFANMGFETQLTSNGFLVFLPNNEHFDLHKANLKPKLVSILENLVNEANKTYLADHKIQVTGHTDSTGSDAYNQALSERRAAAVKKKMIELGTDAQRVSSVGFGETQPRYLDPSQAQYNRRTDLLFINP